MLGTCTRATPCVSLISWERWRCAGDQVSDQMPLKSQVSDQMPLKSKVSDQMPFKSQMATLQN